MKKVSMSIIRYFNIVWGDSKFNDHYSEEDGHGIPSVSSWSLSPEKCCIYRVVKYVMPLNYPVGPKSSRIETTQRIHFTNEKNLIIEVSTASLDVPFGDDFCVEESWSIQEIDEGTTSIKFCGGVSWKKVTWSAKLLKSTIDSSATSACAEHVVKYIKGISKWNEEYTPKLKISNIQETIINNENETNNKMPSNPQEARETNKDNIQSDPNIQIKDQLLSTVETNKENIQSDPSIQKNNQSNKKEKTVEVAQPDKIKKPSTTKEKIVEIWNTILSAALAIQSINAKQSFLMIVLAILIILVVRISFLSNQVYYLESKIMLSGISEGNKIKESLYTLEKYLFLITNFSNLPPYEEQYSYWKSNKEIYTLLEHQRDYINQLKSYIDYRVKYAKL